MVTNWGIREAVCERVRHLTPSQLSGLIEKAQQGNEEKNLPGLGVFFELVWRESKKSDQELILMTLYESLQNKSINSSPT
ncbi:small acid-soluble spore protein SspI [Pasteuria penetrans]|uniref:small acid-soluble spore protein SspI n=1 Tax=Pasteuria penetrans TaxID=86005 RepID=UPI000FBCAA13|nr:small acid-soluble spore protein SspI [Pasteuria penetrans]